jgi:signal transduction histidine kinase
VPEGQWLEVDPDRLTQALLNLLQNAAIHAPGTTPVGLQVARERQWWRFEVSDFGPGLPLDLEDSVFEPFIRGRGSGDGAGSGLGLAIVRGIARAHEGEVGADNRHEEGVTLWIRVPA